MKTELKCACHQPAHGNLPVTPTGRMHTHASPQMLDSVRHHLTTARAWVCILPVGVTGRFLCAGLWRAHFRSAFTNAPVEEDRVLRNIELQFSSTLLFYFVSPPVVLLLSSGRRLYTPQFSENILALSIDKNRVIFISSSRSNYIFWSTNSALL